MCCNKIPPSTLTPLTGRSSLDTVHELEPARATGYRVGIALSGRKRRRAAANAWMTQLETANAKIPDGKERELQGASPVYGSTKPFRSS
jgi:hypothetical protein